MKKKKKLARGFLKARLSQKKVCMYLSDKICEKYDFWWLSCELVFSDFA